MADTPSARLRLLSLLAATVATAATLGACGSGDSSGGSTPAPPPASTDVAVAYAALIGQAHTWNLTAPVQGGTLSATVTLTPGADVSYQGVLYHSTAFASTISEGSQILASNVETLWLDTTTLNPVFYTESVDGSCGLVSSSTQIPAAAQLGATGAQFEAGLFETCALPSQAVTQVGTSTDTWSYEADEGLAFFCLNSSDTFIDSTTSSESDCVEVVDSAGTLGSHARIVEVDANGDTLTFTN